MWIKDIPFAHRGLHDKTTPENSMAAFNKAIDNGYGIELDVRITKDQEAIVFHDRSLKRMTGIKGNVDQLEYNELKKLNLKDTNERISTL